MSSSTMKMMTLLPFFCVILSHMVSLPTTPSTLPAIHSQALIFS